MKPAATSHQVKKLEGLDEFVSKMVVPKPVPTSLHKKGIKMAKESAQAEKKTAQAEQKGKKAAQAVKKKNMKKEPKTVAEGPKGKKDPKTVAEEPKGKNDKYRYIDEDMFVFSEEARVRCEAFMFKAVSSLPKPDCEVFFLRPKSNP